MDISLYALFDHDFSPQTFGIAVLPLSGLFCLALLIALRVAMARWTWLTDKRILGSIIGAILACMIFSSVFSGFTIVQTSLFALGASLSIWPASKPVAASSDDTPGKRAQKITTKFLAATLPFYLVATPIALSATISHLSNVGEATGMAALDEMVVKLDDGLLSEEEIRKTGFSISWFEPEPHVQEIYRKVFKYGSLNLGEFWGKYVAGIEPLPEEPSGQLAIGRINAVRLWDDPERASNLPIWCLYRDGKISASRYTLNHSRSLQDMGGWSEVHALCPKTFNPDNQPMRSSSLSPTTGAIEESWMGITTTVTGSDDAVGEDEQITVDEKIARAQDDAEPAGPPPGASSSAIEDAIKDAMKHEGGN